MEKLLRLTGTMFLSVLLILPFFSCMTQNRIPSGIYEWSTLKSKGNYGIQTRNILKGETRSLKMFEIKAVTLIGGYSVKPYRIKQGADELIIVKEGTAAVSVNGKTERLGEGSIVVTSGGDEIKILNGAKNDLTYYSFRFIPDKSEAQANTVKSIPLIKEWNDIEFRPNANGGRRDIMRQPVNALRELEIHTTQLREGLPSHSAHTHPDEEIILVRFGRVEESINGRTFQCGPGSVLFLTDDDDHGIRNVGEGPCEYYAIRWLTW